MYLPEVVVISTDRFHPFGKFEFMGSLVDALNFLAIQKEKSLDGSTFLSADGTRFYLYRFEAESVELHGLEEIAPTARRSPAGQ